jgi:hypothetical protein
MDFNQFAKQNIEPLDLLSWFAYLPLKEKIEIYLDWLEYHEDHHFDYMKYPNEDYEN